MFVLNKINLLSFCFVTVSIFLIIYLISGYNLTLDEGIHFEKRLFHSTFATVSLHTLKTNHIRFFEPHYLQGMTQKTGPLFDKSWQQDILLPNHINFFKLKD